MFPLKVTMFVKQEFVGMIEMIALITGASHTGKTALAQKLLEKYKYPYLSIDHLKMGSLPHDPREREDQYEHHAEEHPCENTIG